MIPRYQNKRRRQSRLQAPASSFIGGYLGMAARILGSRLRVLQSLEGSFKSSCGCARYAQTAAVEDSIAVNPITKVLIANRGMFDPSYNNFYVLTIQNVLFEKFGNLFKIVSSSQL